MLTHLIAIGDSEGILLPLEILRRAGLRAGDALEVSLLENGSISLKPVHDSNPPIETEAAEEAARARNREVFQKLRFYDRSQKKS